MPHIHDKVDFTAEVFVVHNGKVLLRKHDKYGVWISVGGHIEPDEDPNAAAVREVKEEVGLDVKLYNGGEDAGPPNGFYKDLIVPQFINRHKISDTHDHIVMYYFATADSGELNLSAREKCDGCRWFAKEELDLPDYNINEKIKTFAKRALEKLGGAK